MAWEVKTPKYSSKTKNSWSSPDKEDFNTDKDYYNAHMLWKTDNPKTVDDVALPVARPVSKSSNDVELVFEAMVSAHRMASRVDLLSDRTVKKVRSEIERIARKEFPEYFEDSTISD